MTVRSTRSPGHSAGIRIDGVSCAVWRISLREKSATEFSEPVYVDGSFVTDKETPDDVDVVLDMRRASDDRQFLAFRSCRQGRDRFRRVYSVDFWINLPDENDFSDFFQYLGVKTARYKGLDSAHRKGILRLP
jgi:hypothetical protein